jgi:hypothetical protein
VFSAFGIFTAWIGGMQYQSRATTPATPAATAYPMPSTRAVTQTTATSSTTTRTANPAREEKEVRLATSDRSANHPAPRRNASPASTDVCQRGRDTIGG